MESWKPIKSKMKLKGYSQSTITAYRHHYKQFTSWISTSITDTEVNDVEKYVLELIDQGYARETVRQCHAALSFILKSLGKEKISSTSLPKRKKPLPKVVSKKEIQKMIRATANSKHELIITLLYGSGLRVSEVVNLKPSHINLDRERIFIKDGKGGKDRYTILSNKTRKLLLEYLMTQEHSTYLFPGRNQKLHVKSVQNIVSKAAKKAGLSKHVHPHMLRHSFATHLLESGVDIRYIQKLLGHSRLQTTQLYTKVADSALRQISSPADKMDF